MDFSACTAPRPPETACPIVRLSRSARATTLPDIWSMSKHFSDRANSQFFSPENGENLKLHHIFELRRLRKRERPRAAHCCERSDKGGGRRRRNRGGRNAGGPAQPAPPDSNGASRRDIRRGTADAAPLQRPNALRDDGEEDVSQQAAQTQPHANASCSTAASTSAAASSRR